MPVAEDVYGKEKNIAFTCLLVRHRRNILVVCGNHLTCLLAREHPVVDECDNVQYPG